MNDKEMMLAQQAEVRRGRRWWGGIALAVVGAAGVGLGFAFGIGVKGDQASIAGGVAGACLMFAVAGGAMAWCARPGRPVNEAAYRDGARREKLHRARTQQLLIYPVVLLLFMFQAHRAMSEALGGAHNWGSYLQISLPVLYGWLIPVIVMGWDGVSLKNRNLLDDELTQSIRARSVILAFIVLMSGVTLALVLGLWRVDYGMMALPYVLALGGATAGLRFAWLDREAGRDE